LPIPLELGEKNRIVSVKIKKVVAMVNEVQVKL
jgi:hypothetical protein